ncbi:MAG: DUF3232 domain-containing protein [Patescibacteria group bacterium]
MALHPAEKSTSSKLKEKKEMTPNLDLIEKVLSLIEKTQIDPSGLSADELNKQQRELSHRKKDAQELIDDVLTHTRNYSERVLQMVNFTDSPNRYRMEDWEYKEKMTEFDQRRRASHNALIDSIAIAVRYVRSNFGKLSDEELEGFENDLRRRKKSVLASERVAFPNNIIFPESMNINDRYQIADWAEKLAQESKLRDLAKE